MPYFADISFFILISAWGSRATSTIRFSRLGRNSWSGGSSVRMTTGKPSMALKRPGEIGALHGQELLQRFAAGFFVARQNHLLHEGQAIFGEEHMLGAAEADAFGAELAGDVGVARDIGIGAHAELAAELVGPAHELADESCSRLGSTVFAWP